MTYSKAEMVSAIRSCGVENGDLVMAHVGMSSLRDLPEGVRGQDAMSAFCADALLECVGSEGTLVIPSFTYSLGAGEIYDPKTTPCKDIGPFPEYFRKQPGVLRSRDPFLAVASIGSRSRELLDDIANTSYGKGSFFDRFTEMGGKILCIGVGIRWATIRYHYDEIGGAPFRYLKRFSGKMKVDDKAEDVDWIYSVAPRAPKVDAMSRQQGFMIEQLLEGSHLLKRAALGRGRVCSIVASDYRAFILDMLRKDPWASSGGAISSLAEMIAAENERTGVEKYEIDLADDGAESMIAKIERIPREPMSDGYDAVIAALARRFGLAIEEFATGRRAGDLIVPERKIGDLRSFSSMKIARVRHGATKAGGERVVCDMTTDLRRIVEALFAIESAKKDGKAIEDIELVIVPSKEYAILAEGL